MPDSGPQLVVGIVAFSIQAESVNINFPGCVAGDEDEEPSNNVFKFKLQVDASFKQALIRVGLESTLESTTAGVVWSTNGTPGQPGQLGPDVWCMGLARASPGFSDIGPLTQCDAETRSLYNLYLGPSDFHTLVVHELFRSPPTTVTFCQDGQGFGVPLQPRRPRMFRASPTLRHLQVMRSSGLEVEGIDDPRTVAEVLQAWGHPDGDPLVCLQLPEPVARMLQLGKFRTIPWRSLWSFQKSRSRWHLLPRLIPECPP